MYRLAFENFTYRTVNPVSSALAMDGLSTVRIKTAFQLEDREFTFFWPHKFFNVIFLDWIYDVD
jgi:hypothetical protein